MRFDPDAPSHRSQLRPMNGIYRCAIPVAQLDAETGIAQLESSLSTGLLRLVREQLAPITPQLLGQSGNAHFQQG